MKFPELSPTTWSGTNNPHPSVWPVPVGSRELRGANLQGGVRRARHPGPGAMKSRHRPHLALTHSFGQEKPQLWGFFWGRLLRTCTLPLQGAMAVHPSPKRRVWECVRSVLDFPEVWGVLALLKVPICPMGRGQVLPATAFSRSQGYSWRVQKR